MNERTGTIIMGAEVRVLPVAIAHGSLQVAVTTDYDVSQPNAFSEGRTVVVPESTIVAKEGKKYSLALLRPGVTLGQLVAGLNALGVTPQDLIAVLEAIKSAGALEADMEMMRRRSDSASSCRRRRAGRRRTCAPADGRRARSLAPSRS